MVTHCCGYVALAAWGARLQSAAPACGAGGFDQDLDEEHEDAEGNVYNRKTYVDLKRQGLL